MKKLSKADSKRKLELSDKLDAASDKLVDEIREYNEKVRALWTPVEGAKVAYNELVGEANEFRGRDSGGH